MVKLLLTHFNRQLDKQTASTLTLGEVIDTNPTLANSREMIMSAAQSFVDLWSRLNKTLSVKMNSRIVNQFNKRSDADLATLGNFRVQKREDNRELAMIMPVSYFLPATHGDGIYIYALILFLVDAHNEFLNFYHGLPHRYFSKVSSTRRRVDLDEVNEVNCIAIEPRRDLLNTVYLNSNYTLECASELSFEYDYIKIQRNIEARFVARKPIIESKVFNDSFNLNILSINNFDV